MKNLGGILLGIATLLAGSAVFAEVFYVDRDFQGEQPTGRSWHSAFPSIQEAINAATSGGEIWVKSGVYKPCGTTRGTTFELKSDIVLYGGFRGTETTLAQRNPRANRTILSGDIGRTGSRADNCWHVVTAAEGCRIDGFIVASGQADGTDTQGVGAALLIGGEARKVSVSNCTFEKNHATMGGAIHTSAAGTTLSNCTFYSNSAETGGGILIGDGAGIQMVDCKFNSNFARESGGAVAIRSTSKIEISHSWFLFNRTDGTGGALAGSSQQKRGILLVMDDCEFSDNSATKNGGGLFSQGAFFPELTQCRFIRNVSEQGGGAMASQDGATVSFLKGTLTRNQSAKGFTEITSDTLIATVVAAPVTNLVVQPKPVAVGIPKSQLADLSIYTAPNRRLSFSALVTKNDYIVFSVGDLSDPEFITSYRTVEAAARDYLKKGVGFFYIQSYLAHPENNSYVQPVTLAERFQLTLETKRLLRTRIPWLCDGMDNSVAKMLNREVNTLFIYHKDGREEYAGNLADAEGFRKSLASLAGQVASPAKVDDFAAPDIAPIRFPSSRFVKRVKIDPRKNAFLTLQTSPLKSRTPAYVKLRAEASKKLLKTGDGRMYLGFHIDPLYQAKWNNLAAPLEYTIKMSRGTAMSPSSNRAIKIKQSPTDSGPREFMLEVRKWDVEKPVSITVTCSILSGRSNRMVEVSQRYILYLKHDPFGGSVIGRQIPGSEKEKETTYTILLFKHFDDDRDGMLSYEEAPGSLQKDWDDFDANSDGFLTEAEYRKHRKK